MRPGDPSAPRIGTKPAKNGTRLPTGSWDRPVSCWIRIAPRSRIALWTTKSSDVKSVSRADRRRVLLEQLDGDRLVLAEERGVDHDRIAADAVQRHVGGGLAVGSA